MLDFRFGEKSPNGERTFVLTLLNFSKPKEEGGSGRLV